MGDFNYDPNKKGAETEVDREIRQFLGQINLNDVSYSEACAPRTTLLQKEALSHR